MAYSWQEQIKPAGTQDIQCDIEYLDKSYIHVYLDGVETTGYTWTSSTNIRLNTALTADTTVLLIRKTEREYLYIEFASGSPFIEVNVDSQNTQFLHLAQELVEGRAIPGFYGDISMNGYRITNLGDGTTPGDAVNKGQLDEVDARLDSRITTNSHRITQLEQTWLVPSSSYPWFTNTTAETDVLTPGFTFTKAAVYINGVCQTPGYSYEVVDNTIMLADPVPAGTHIMARLGEDVPNEQGYATAVQLANTNLRVDAVEAVDTALTARVSTLESELSILSSEVDQDLAALINLTTVVDGKASKGAQGRTDLGLGNLATRNQGAAVADAAGAPTQTEFNNLLTSLRNAGIIAT